MRRKGRIPAGRILACLLLCVCLLSAFAGCGSAGVVGGADGPTFAFLTSCGGKTPSKYSSTFLDVFDTVTELTAYCGSEAIFEQASEAVHRELLRIHRLCDVYHSYEGIVNLYSVNEAGGERSFCLDPDLIALLQTGEEFYRASGGKLNVAMGSVVSLWHDCLQGGENAVLPAEEALNSAGEHMGFGSVSVSAAENTLTVGDPDVRFDFGAVAKGYAAERAAEVARQNGLSDFALNIGGNVLLSGKKPSGNWTIGVQAPDGGVFTKLSLTDASAVTSGDYQRFVVLDGVRYHHIIDPDTLRPASLYRSVTIVCEDSLTADALSTALFCMTLEDGKALARERRAEALWIFEDGSSVRTEGFAAYEE